MNKKILFLNSNTHHLFGQQHLMQALASQGNQVVLLTPDDTDYFVKLIGLGYDCVPLLINSKSLNPLDDIRLVKHLFAHFKKIQPDLILSFTIKPNIFGAIAASLAKIPLIANVTGLGYVFIRGGLVTKIAIKLYKFAFRRASYVFCQNIDDFSLLNGLNIFTNPEKVAVIPGSGVNLTKFSYVGLLPTKEIKFLYSGRLLWDKGIEELIMAFRRVKVMYPNVRLLIMGAYFYNNPAAILPEQVNQWVEDESIEYLGMVDNVVEIMAEVDCVVLPSYREGMPRSLLEASSMGKPIITVDSVGCKDVVDNEVTGYMAKVKDVDSLAVAMIRFVELPFQEKVQMGLNGRRKMEKEFDQQIVVKKYLEAVECLLNITRI